MENLEAPSDKSIVEEINQQLETDQELKHWFEKFNKSSWKYFIGHYASTKRRALMFPTLYVNDFKPMNKEFNEYAKKALEYIQQVKLFLMQCEWRAGKLKIPFVQISTDFEIFGRHIMECPFLPPVSQEEMELYCRFLEQPEGDQFDNYEHVREWQDYNAMKHEKDGETMFGLSAWHEFYMAHYGVGFLLDLPNVRGEKEEYYCEVGFKEKKKKEEKEKGEKKGQITEPPFPHAEFEKPTPNYEEDLMDFARRYEEPDDVENVIDQIRAENHHGDFEYHDRLYDYLKLIPEPISFVPHHDWKESLELTVIRYKKGKIIEALPRVWRQYNKDIGDDPEAYLHRRMAAADKDLVLNLDTRGWRAAHANWILEGRRVLGEPENLDYWEEDEL